MIHKPREQGAYLHRVRVYWEDTDAGGVVFYANYLKFFERARTEWLRALGFSQTALARDWRAMFVVTDANIGYRAPERLDVAIDVTVGVQRLGGASITVGQQALRDTTLLAEGTVRMACVDPSSFAPRRMPPAVVQRLSGLAV